MNQVVTLRPRAQKDFDKIPKVEKIEIVAMAEELEEEGPAIHGATSFDRTRTTGG